MEFKKKQLNKNDYRKEVIIAKILRIVLFPITLIMLVGHEIYHIINK